MTKLILNLILLLTVLNHLNADQSNDYDEKRCLELGNC